jgi:ring-1,2-phenylacetyl-CoA epoxidase subunit PaaD
MRSIPDAAARPPADPDVARAWAALATVRDPEIPALTIIDLGIVRSVERVAGRFVVTITPTYSGCPAHRTISEDAARALAAAGLPGARIDTRLAPPWTTDWISDAGREKLRAFGIAPPGRVGAERDPSCPRCGAATTEMLSPFGATACKAMWRCLACREPFEAFKCH